MRVTAILNLVIGVVPISALMLASGRPAEIAAATSLILATMILVRFIMQGHTMLIDLLQLQRQTRDLAHTDPLTGLANRHALDEVIAASLRKGGSASPFKLVLLDLDGFKPVNDRHGHAFGDKLLCGVADRLREAVGDGGLVVRQGGDEFAVLIPAQSALHNLPVADRLLIALVRPHVIEGISVSVGASVGVAQWPADAADADALFDFADRALYQAKAATRTSREEAADPAAETALRA